LKRGYEDIHAFVVSPTNVNHNYIPGTYDDDLHRTDGNIPSRYYVDVRDIDNAILAIFKDSYLNSNDDTEQLSVGHLINLLRFKNITVPKNSLLWNLGVRLFDACAQSPHYLSYDVGMIPLLKGIWNDLVGYVQYCWDQTIYIPNINIVIGPEEIGINREFNLLHQKLCMINCCIYRKSGKLPSAGHPISKSELSQDSNGPVNFEMDSTKGTVQ
jgi:hypothetical protein